ncbi:MAG: 16S rRNA (adenine(1518)-N(6)/adenine(1519)-N(6))-dimethyltransferase RsmA [Prolixibacteraceae bacterium]|jgi:16S rRNA (adenine1518-N6/adenine1519-N6)-dimethyltransferase|nr:16S rRNA (adenine(1518)-N(6)/adenine(1519)-N(6))-dimethyltransferase RsmA [Prolixibacteraceae bacterium]MDD4756127.1 16S rRNA (adenine(1518)-N(6)/adenine(1519)-N(6))-dimethyltransferase RsmA [Prolixibacteraceae bacterium]
MIVIRPKKKLGQHFLRDQNIARKIVDKLGATVPDVVEVGPGMGILTRFLLQRSDINLYAVEIDRSSVEYLVELFPSLSDKLFQTDFITWDASSLPGKFSIIGNFPYNISSQIFFKILDMKERIPEVVCMVQKEVADRINASHGNKTYGILSVLTGAFYNREYLFTVPPDVFFPPPKVQSAVIRLKRNSSGQLPCDERLFFKIVKQSFGQRRKMLRNSLKEPGIEVPVKFAERRPEQLSVDDFIELTGIIEHQKPLDYAI